MALALVKVGVYNKYSDQKMVTECGAILDTIEKNAPISELVTRVTATRAQYKEYVEAFNLAAGKATQAIARKKETKSTLCDAMMLLAIGVNYFAAGNTELLAQTGMPMEKARDAKVKSPFEKPEWIKAVNCGNSGCVKVTVGKAVGAVSFIYQYTLDPVTDSSVWISDGAKDQNFVWEGLKPGTTVWFRVIAIGTRKRRLTSDAVSCIVI